ncbi:anti-sigma factor [Amycolatopsis viridis]|uniref:Regulator of SigK n=1 Tax=Amycolatopsis viridis TaxID=185678 RepID=A0ABX0SQ43_9PSEU|nr:anti-sigma factor [Amycolatopsis viridis]NIH79084.1 anti-sigma-K factor RskA [Amycolatopsis viridis]
MTTPDVHLLTGAYALDALDEVERRRFERHMAECAECTQEVAELRATTARLGLAVSQPPPPDLKSQVLTRIAETRQDPPVTSGRPRRRLALRLVSVAAAVAVAVAAGLGVVAVRTSGQLTAARSELAQTQARDNAIAELLSAPDLRAVPGQHGSVLVSQRLDRGLLLVSGMPATPPGSAYQAWTIVGGTPRSIGVLGGEPLLFDGLRGVRQIAMTVEPAGGSPQPTTAPVATFGI